MDAVTSFVEATKKRFASDPHYRRWMKCNSSDPASAEYQRGLQLACRVEAKSVADAAKSPGHFDDATSPAAGDKISRLLKNNAVAVA